ncbi:MAG: hypothetical protein LBS01_03245 [Prevotellaceae bacterium]|jgi:hypothetical protein|nr:hypothetical protein [Prevotellaceae bacterium]
MKKKIITAGIIAVIAIVAFLNVNVALKSEVNIQQVLVQDVTVEVHTINILVQIVAIDC